MNTKLAIAPMICGKCGRKFDGKLPKGLADRCREFGHTFYGICPDCKHTLYCVMIPTHRNPTGRWFDFKWQRKFGRRHDEAIKKSVATTFGGYTLLGPAEGCYTPGPNVFLIEGMRPFLFIADSEWSAQLIADVVCLHYGQVEVMLSVWSKDVQFRPKLEGLADVYTNMLYRNPPSFFRTIFDRLRKAIQTTRGGRTLDRTTSKA